MNFATVIVILLLAACVAWAIRLLKKNNGHTCSACKNCCDCGCGMGDKCKNKTKDSDSCGDSETKR